MTEKFLDIVVPVLSVYRSDRAVMSGEAACAPETAKTSSSVVLMLVCWFDCVSDSDRETTSMYGYPVILALIS